MRISPGFLPQEFFGTSQGAGKTHLPWLEYHWPPRAALHSSETDWKPMAVPWPWTYLAASRWMVERVTPELQVSSSVIL